MTGEGDVQVKSISSINPNAVDVSTIKDGGVLKEIKKEGYGDDNPISGEKVFVHYIGTLEDGTVFDSSRDRGEYFEFMLGKGNVIKAWDMGVATMKKGEVAILTCKPEYAYGESGSPPKIPPNATLVFEIELFDWKAEDLSSEKDEGILRRQLVKGEGYALPNEGALIDVHIIGRYQNAVFEDRDVTFSLGEGLDHGIVDGIELALQKFKKGERSKLTLKSIYAFGANGKIEYGIPPNSDVEYEVHLKNFEKAKESWEMNLDEKLEQSEIVKVKGTNYFKIGKYNLALKQYMKIISYLENETSAKDEQVEKRKQLLMLAGYLNIAMCHLKLGENLDVIKQCDKALELDKDNEKGLFRRGMAWLSLNDFNLARKDFQAVLNLDPSNKAAHNQLLITNNKMKEQNDKDKRMYMNMFRPESIKEVKAEENQEKANEKLTAKDSPSV